MTTRLELIALTLALAVPLQAMSASPQWKWKDASGRVTVSDLPPPRDIPAENILRRPKTMATAPVPAEPAASAASMPRAVPSIDPELQARLDAAAKDKAAKARAEEAKLAQQRAENCQNARKHLAALESGHRIARYNDKGEREILGDEQRDAEARRAREVIGSECR